jgi:hypothetical protein
MSETVWQRNDNWVGTQVEDRFVMVGIESGDYVALNRTADAIWQALAEPRTVQELCDALCAQFEIAHDACAAAVENTLGRMHELELAAPR